MSHDTLKNYVVFIMGVFTGVDERDRTPSRRQKKKKERERERERERKREREKEIKYVKNK